MDWTSFKNIADSLGLSIQIQNEDTIHYDLVLYNGQHVFSHHMLKDDGVDHLDFETNYKPSSNQAIEARNVNNPFATNILPNGKVLYIKVHGQKTNINPGETHPFKFVVPYENGVFFQGAEIFQDIVGITDLHIKYPVPFPPAPPLAGTSAEQYGFNVNLGVIKYQKESPYVANIPMGFSLDVEVTNDTDTVAEYGVNFLMHEIRDPA